MVDPIQITVSGGLASIAGYFLKDFLARHRPPREDPPTLQALQGAVAELRSIVTDLRGIAASIPAVQSDVIVLQQQVRQTRGDIARIDADLTDVRREAADHDDRIRKLERER